VTEGAREQQSRGVGGLGTRTAAWLAWTLCAVSLLILALALLLIVLGWSTPLPEGWIPWQGQVISSIGMIGPPVVGGLIASRRPSNLYGWLWLGFGLALSLLLFAQVYAAYAQVAQPEALPASRTVGTVVAGVGWTVAIGLVPFLLLLFPSGRLPSHRWRFVTGVIAVAGSVALTAGPFAPGRSAFVPLGNPLGVVGTVGEVIFVLVNASALVILVTIVPSALSLVLRYRRSGGVERQQLKWFAYAAVLLVAEFSIQFVYEPPGTWDALLEVVPLTVLYVAVGIAILRYRLYEIDIIINRTLVYATLTATLAGVYFGGIGALQWLFVLLTGQKSTLAVVASTLLIAALFNPLRRGIQGFIDRRFYRRKYDARKTLQAFSVTLREETDLTTLNDELVGVVRETMQPAHVSLWLRPDTVPRGEQRPH
jgi:hypothetical protein